MTRASMAAIGLSLLLAACSPHKVTTNPAPPVEVASSYSVTATGQLPEKWWREFSDPQLDKLVESTLSGNLQLRAAWARLRQVGAIARQASSGKWPQLEATARASRSEQFNPFAANDPSGMTPSSFQQDNFRLSLAAAYEVDVWRRVGNQARAAYSDHSAVRRDAESIAIGLVAETAEAWFDLVGQRAQRKLLEQQVETNRTFLELMRLRFKNGLATAGDIHQQQQQLISRRARLALVDAAIELIAQRLAVLSGKSPRAIRLAVTDTLPDLPPPPAIGVPSDLLGRRPDVAAARLRVEAADLRVAVAVADRLPALRVGASGEFQSTKIVDLFATPLWSIFASITSALFDGGRRKAEVARQRAVVEERLYGYGQALLTATAEVEAAITQERQQRIYIGELTEQLEVANNALRETRRRYREGVHPSGFLSVLTALTALQNTEVTLLDAKRQLISYRIQLYRALGGTWSADLEAPPPAELETAERKPKAAPAPKKSGTIR